MQIKEEILKILNNCTIQDNTVFLPSGQLDRKTYLETNKCLENLGGKWNRKAKGHVFEDDPTDSFNNMLLTGETTDFKKEFQFFETPPELADKMIDMAELEKGDWVLEPSAGQGAILDRLRAYRRKTGIDFSYTGIELSESNCKVLNRKLYFPIQEDFLTRGDYIVDQANKIIMNPPFTKQQDVDHILHAYSLLDDGGILVSIVSESPFFRENKKSVEFREFLVTHNAEIIKLPEGTFKASGTMVRTRIIKISKAEK